MTSPYAKLALQNGLKIGNSSYKFDYLIQVDGKYVPCFKDKRRSSVEFEESMLKEIKTYSCGTQSVVNDYFIYYDVTKNDLMDLMVAIVQVSDLGAKFKTSNGRREPRYDEITLYYSIECSKAECKSGGAYCFEITADYHDSTNWEEKYPYNKKVNVSLSQTMDAILPKYVNKIYNDIANRLTNNKDSFMTYGGMEFVFELLDKNLK